MHAAVEERISSHFPTWCMLTDITEWHSGSSAEPAPPQLFPLWASVPESALWEGSGFKLECGTRSVLRRKHIDPALTSEERL